MQRTKLGRDAWRLLDNATRHGRALWREGSNPTGSEWYEASTAYVLKYYEQLTDLIDVME